ncbi:MAG: type II secretion system F family protein [Proteobacteria bacterium]|nr:type II secretion system F family protein [Pseudomonadota bacterium]
MIGLIVLAVFGAVALLVLVVSSVAAHGLRIYEERYLAHGTSSLGEMFIFIQPRQLLVLTLSVAVVGGLLGWLLMHWFIGLVLVLAGLTAPRAAIKHLRRKRVRAFDRQLGDALVRMAAAFRAGLTLAQAMDTLSQETPPPLGEEFKLAVRELTLGVAQDQALVNLGERVGSESLKLVVTATNIARQLGANLAEMYDIISDAIRERFQIESKVDALTAMGRMQSWIIGLMPGAVGVAFYFMRRDLMEPMLGSAFGVTLVAAVLLMELVGLWLIRRMTEIEF